MIIYLYKKTHQITGLKYLGKTTKDPYKYLGSGLEWKSHLKEFGKFIDTEIIRECHSKEELSIWGRHYSKLWDVVNNNDWANKIPETGGSDSGKNHPCYGRKNNNVGKSNSLRAGDKHPMYGKSNPQLSARNSANVGYRNPMFGKISAMRGKKNPKLSELNALKTGSNNPMCKPEYQITCEYCDKITSKGNYVRWHGYNCKMKDSGNFDAFYSENRKENDI